jgi:hypothetical protein
MTREAPKNSDDRLQGAVSLGVDYESARMTHLRDRIVAEWPRLRGGALVRA